jgi:hypothetical protein
VYHGPYPHKRPAASIGRETGTGQGFVPIGAAAVIIL